MVLDDLSQRDRRGVAAAFIAVAAVSIIVGYAGAGLMDSSGGSASEAEIETLAQSLMDQQMAQQEQQLAAVANQSENISQSDISVSANVDDVSLSDIGSLYRVSISITGEVPSQTGGVESVDQEQTLYISSDGRYVFQAPTDLEAQQQQASGSQTGSSGQTSGQAGIPTQGQ